MYKSLTLITAVLTTFFVSIAQAQTAKIEDFLEQIEKMKSAIPQEKNELVNFLVKSSLPLAGVGIMVGEENNSVVVEETIKGLPAEDAGITKNDQIVSINEKPVSSAEEAIERIRGDGSVGRKIVIKILRQNKELTFTLTTVMIRKDKTAEANKLAQSIEKEFSTLAAKIRTSLDSLTSALKAGSVNFDKLGENNLIQTINSLLLEFSKWFAEKENQVLVFLNN